MRPIFAHGHKNKKYFIFSNLKVMKKLFVQYMDKDYFKVLEGGVEVAKAITTKRFVEESRERKVGG